MKKIYILSILGFIMFSFTSCDNKQKLAKTPSKDVSVVMVSAIGYIDDKSFNQNTWEGILKFAKEHNMPKSNFTYVSSHRPEDYAINLSNFADKSKSLIVGPGYELEDAVNKVASKYPNQRFLLIDAVSSVDKNVLSVTFATEQGSFLAGICTALKAKQMGLKTVGFIGGIDGYIVQKFEAGYIEGIKAIDPNIQVMVQYVNDFSNPSKGQKIGSYMYDRGIKIIFAAAGASGKGLIKEAKKRAKMGEEVWVVGVDRDQYEDGLYENGKSVILTSSLKKLDNATYDALNSIKNDNFKAGHIVYSLKNDGVGLPKTNPNLKDEWMKIVDQYKKDIISGKIKVSVKPKRVLGQDIL